MFNASHSIFRAAAVVTLLGSVAISTPVLAAPEDGSGRSGPPNSTIELNSKGHVTEMQSDTSETATEPSPASPSHDHMTMRHHHPEDMQKHIEQRITTLHDKLKITKDQEATWTNVAQAMRENETTIGGLIHERHEHPAAMTAVDDLESYQKIAQAHADGLKKVVSAFESLYDMMSEAQKKNADMVFSHFEGHHDGKKN